MTTRHVRTMVCLVTLLTGMVALRAASDSGYRVGPEDVLRIVVWKQPDLSGTFSVSREGTVTLPLIGALQVDGLTPERIGEALQARLAEGFVKQPQVTVTIEQYESQRIFVAGEVRTPGSIALTGSLSLLEAIARAGSTTEHAGGQAIIARPRERPTVAGPAAFDGSAEILRIDLQALARGQLSHNVALRDGDTVFVPRADTLHVMGEVRSPGEYPFLPTTTVAEVLARAGGVTERGSTRRVRVMRTVEGRKVELKVRLDDTLLPGDVLVVRERLF